MRPYFDIFSVLTGDAKWGLFDLGFHEFNVLADDGIVFLDPDLVRRLPFVFGGRIIISSPRGGDEFDFFTHDKFSGDNERSDPTGGAKL